MGDMRMLCSDSLQYVTNSMAKMRYGVRKTRYPVISCASAPAIMAMGRVNVRTRCVILVVLFVWAKVVICCARCVVAAMFVSDGGKKDRVAGECNSIRLRNKSFCIAFVIVPLFTILFL